MKLYEVLAANDNARGQEATLKLQLIETFTKKKHLFDERVEQTTVWGVDGQPDKIERNEKPSGTTVVQELDWLRREALQRGIDMGFQINQGNAIARADVILEDGTVFWQSAPPTALMELLKRLGELKDLVMAIPTLDSAKGFRPDPEHGAHQYKALDTKRPVTEKRPKALVMYPATDKFPAQVKDYMEDVVVGEKLIQEWSGMITPAQKAEMLSRCEHLMRAVQKARSRANEVEVPKEDGPGNKILDYVFAPAK